MKKRYMSSFMGRFLVCALFTIAGIGSLNAQTVVINTGTPGTPQYNAGPIYRSAASSAYDASRYSYLYTADELAAVGITSGAVINVLGWIKDNNATSTGGGIFRIYMKNSSATTYGLPTESWANLNNGTTMVYENLSFTVPATQNPDYITFPLSVPFTYTGGSLEISTEWDINGVAGNASTGTFNWMWSTVVDRIYGTGQTVLANAGTLSSTSNSISDINDRRPFLQITFTPGGPCTNPPTPGTVTANPSSVCLGETFTLSMAGGTSGTGQTIQWQSSPDGVTWTDIAGATNFTYSSTQTTTTNYRALITCGVAVPTNAVQISTPASVLGTFTINNALPTGGGNFASFNDAYDFIKCGIGGNVIFNVVAGSGPYNEQLIMNPVPGAGPGATVTFNGNGASMNFTSTNTNERAVVKLNGADFINFNDLIINSSGTTTSEYGFGFQLLNNADNNTINNCTINLNTSSTSTNYAGIVVGGTNTSATASSDNNECDNNIIVNNTINGGYYGITIVGSATVANRANQIIANNINDIYTYGIYALGTSFMEVEGNQIQRPTRTTLGTFYGIYFTSLSTAAIVTKNRISNPCGGDPNSTVAMYGIYVTAVDAFAGVENRFTNNLIHNFNGSGASYGIYNAGSDNVFFYHNTISLDGTAPSATSSTITRGFYQTTQAGGIQFKNNIISITRGGDGPKYAIYLNTLTSVVDINRNDYYLGSLTGVSHVGYNGADRTLLSDWQAQGYDLNSVTNDPEFTNPAIGNYSPLNPAIDNLGEPLGVTQDINNATRSLTTPDLGAYEFTPPPCVAPPVGGTAELSQAVVCENEIVALSVTGNSAGLTQTYVWQSSPDGVNWTDISGVLTNPNFNITATVTLNYRILITCTGQTTPSASALLTVNPALPLGNYTINPDIPASATNYQSFADAILALRCGIAGPVTFNVNATPATLPGGFYNEQIILPTILNASAINTVTFIGNGAVIRFLPQVNDQRAVIKLDGADHVTFDGFDIDGSLQGGTYAFGVQLINGADSNTFRNNIIRVPADQTTTAYAGIVISNSATAATTTGNTDCDFNLFENNDVIGGYYGATIVGATATPVIGNQLVNNRFRDFYFYGIYINATTNTLVEKNDLTRPTRTTNSAFYGIYATGISTGMKVSKNKIHDPFTGIPGATAAFYGIYFTGVDATQGAENDVTNNLIYNVISNGTVYGLYNTSSDFARYYHNTISLDDQTNTSTSLTRGFYQITTSAGIELKNNLITLTRAGGGTNHGLYFGTSTSDIVHDYNNVYTGGLSTTYWGYNGANRATLADWATSTGQEANGEELDPEYANVPVNDYTPTLGAIDNQGTPVPGVTTDINDAPRSATTPDIGAIEFAVPPCVEPPVAGAATVVPNSGICLGVTVTLSLSGNSIGGGQTYQWQSAPTAAGPWTDISGLLNNPVLQWPVGVDTFFRAVVICNGGQPAFSTITQVSLNPLFLGGVYTINPVGGDFPDFTSAVLALDCGITDAVTFLVAPGTYTEQIRMKYVAGTAPNKRVTFQSANGDPASVTLTWDASTSAGNYVLMLDSSEYITYKDMTITQISATNGRVIQMANTASYDSLTNLIINTPTSTSTADINAAIYGTDLRGRENVVSHNTISSGSQGIRLEGLSIAIPAESFVIDSNRISGFYSHGIYNDFTSRLKVRGNIITVTSPSAGSIYGIYGTNTDSAFDISANRITIENSTSISYGIYNTISNATAAARARIANNKVTAVNGNTGNLYGIYQTGTTFCDVRNNVVSVNSSASTVYGLYLTGGSGNTYYNNSANNNATATGNNNVAAYFSQTSGGSGDVDIRNNVFTHMGGGIAYHIANTNFVYSDYNYLYTTGATLVRAGTVNHPTLQSLINAVFWDVNSIVYPPAYTNMVDLEPDVTAPDVWAMHGRGVHIETNTYDFNDQPRPVTLTTGVPDMGAFEFVPSSLPTILIGTPATPAPGITQTFMYGTDTVIKVTYAAGSTVPDNLTFRRYSGVIPPALATGQESMYFYTEAQITGSQPSNYSVKKYYIDPWQGFIPAQPYIKLGRTDNTNTWLVNAASTVDEIANVFEENSLNFMDKFTGLTDGTIPPPVVQLPTPDSSNRGTRFWVGYGHHQNFGSGNSQDMILYFSAEQAANVKVRLNGTGYVREYSVPANSVITSQLLPKSGIYDSRLLVDGKSTRGISIESDVPIVAYAHIYASTTSEAAMLMPVGTYGYEYTALTTKQNYASNTYSWFYVIADHDSTWLEVTPSNVTLGGSPAGVPFIVKLNKGEVYQALGAIISGSDGFDLTGSTVKSIQNNQGRCLPFAMFSGSSRTNIGCGTSNPTASGDNIIEQNFPYSAWGKKYLIAPTSNSSSASSFHTNIFRVAVKNPATVVRRNGVPLTGLVNNFYYQFESNTADVIEADQPIIVAQIMASSTYCPNTSGGGDPAMVYVSPVEQGIKRTGMYRNTQSAITTQYLTLIVPTAGLASLSIDGGTYDHTYAHNEPGYSVAVKRWSPATNAQVIVECDSAFTAITYGLGSVESYAYNAGTLVRNLNGSPAINNTLATGTQPDYTCVNAPFEFSIRVNIKPVVLTWGLSQAPTLTPNVDVVENNPTPVDSTFTNGQWYYDFVLAGSYSFTQAGTFNIPIYIEHPDVEGCGNRLEITLSVLVKPAPVASFTEDFTGCLGDATQFNGVGVTPDGVNITTWSWNFGDNTTSTVQNPTHTYAAPGVYTLNFEIVGADGCIGDSTVDYEVFDRPVPAVVEDTLNVCNATDAVFEIDNPVTGVTYNWYNTETGGTPLASGTTFTASGVTGTQIFWVEAVAGNCTSVSRVRVVAIETPPLAAPVVTLGATGPDFVTFNWNAVTGATGYEVSVDNGTTWADPSTGPTGLSHTVSGLLPLESVTLIVRATTGTACLSAASQPVTGTAGGDDLYIPNAFTPNGDGLNDVMQVYGRTIESLKFVVFNQWGEKIHESTNQSNVWDGKHRGKIQPSGVYIYVCEIILRDGTKQIKKGSINLIR
ncbi:MAG TPA: gliding motility-associated C-terminal domain-containing protein [Ferruginibacter sp.]|nr:gliding motility-associated C-terminal domain-containing protein [Ferruginibacter sp.]